AAPGARSQCKTRQGQATAKEHWISQNNHVYGVLMSDRDDLIQPDRGQEAIAIHLVNKDGYADWAKTLSGPQRAALAGQKFDGSGYQVGIVPDGDGWFAVGGVADPG